jgi:hypothetical protein
MKIRLIFCLDGKLEPVGIEVNSHDCTINCQLFEFMNPHTQGNAVKPYVETITKYMHRVENKSIKPGMSSCAPEG